MQSVIEKFSISRFILENKALLLLLYWPLFGIIFWGMELFRVNDYHPIESALDSLIPFSEWFVIPYFFWFIYIIGSIVWFFFKDREALAKYMWFTIISYTAVLVIYFAYPTSQHLRPEVKGEGVLFDVVRWLYGYDTNTNVCPSIHVIGSFAVMLGALSAKSIHSVWIKVFYVVAAILISISTVFIKQHSIVDVFWGVILSAASYPLVFCNNKISRFFLECVDIK